MCNYAVNSITFSSRNFSMLQDLHMKIADCCQSTDHTLVRDLVVNLGFADTKIEEMSNCRDYFSDCDKTVIKRGKTFYFCCETTTAWTANMEPIFMVLQEKYHGKINISFMTEEPGCEIFQIFDETGCFYQDRYKVDFCYHGEFTTEYFRTYIDAISFLMDAFPLASLSVYDSLANVKAAIDDVYDEGEDYFFNIYRFTDYVPEKIFLQESEVA